MRTTVVNLRDVDRNDPDVVYIGRPTRWGNPFKIGRDGDRATVIDKYRRWITSMGLEKDLHELVGKRLACWCAPLPCHGDVLAELAEAQETYIEYINTERQNDA